MKNLKFIGILFVAAGIILLQDTPAMAGRGCTGFNLQAKNFVAVAKTAPGTKYDTTLTIYYEDDDSCGDANLKNMYFFLRLEGNTLVGAEEGNPLIPGKDIVYSGREFLSFGSVQECIPYWVGPPGQYDCGPDNSCSGEEAIEVQQAAIESFFNELVIPDIYDCVQPHCPLAKLKSIDKIVEDDPSGFPEFVMMDIVIAIDD